MSMDNVIKYFALGFFWSSNIAAIIEGGLQVREEGGGGVAWGFLLLYLSLI